MPAAATRAESRPTEPSASIPHGCRLMAWHQPVLLRRLRARPSCIPQKARRTATILRKPQAIKAQNRRLQQRKFRKRTSQKPRSAPRDAPISSMGTPQVAVIGRRRRRQEAIPPDWSDDKIIGEIESVANDPASSRTVQPNGRTRVEGIRDGVDIRVIVDPDGTSIRTAHPINR